jgi:aminopeptidase N
MSTTTLVMTSRREHMTLRLDHEPLEISADRVASYKWGNGVLRLEGVGDGGRVTVRGRVDYRARPHGLSRLVDTTDGRAYVVASGALGGAPHFAACEDGPADRMPTTLMVSGASGTVLATGDRIGAGRFVGRMPLASHHLSVVAGPWQRHEQGAVSVLVRRSLSRAKAVADLLSDTERALAWLLDWFGGPAPWGRRYAQVLLPDPPWLGMEHPGCVLLSERLLGRDDVDRADDLGRGRRVAVLAHEAAHQWLGNLVSPRRWNDMGVFEGLAEVLGQLACEALLGEAARPFLERRRRVGPLPATQAAPEARTAGLAEVAGPVQHAALFLEVRDELGAKLFHERVRKLCRRHRGAAVTGEQVWAALGVEPRRPHEVPLPVVASGAADGFLEGLISLRALDPATAVERARGVLRALPPGPERAHAALAAIHDPRVPATVVAGLSSELATALALAKMRKVTSKV